MWGWETACYCKLSHKTKLSRWLWRERTGGAKTKKWPLACKGHGRHWSISSRQKIQHCMERRQNQYATTGEETTVQVWCFGQFPAPLQGARNCTPLSTKRAFPFDITAGPDICWPTCITRAWNMKIITGPGCHHSTQPAPISFSWNCWKHTCLQSCKATTVQPTKIRSTLVQNPPFLDISSFWKLIGILPGSNLFCHQFRIFKTNLKIKSNSHFTKFFCEWF